MHQVGGFVHRKQVVNWPIVGVHMAQRAPKVFCSYSHRDRELKEALEKHFTSLMLAGRISEFWSDDHITAGTMFDPRIRDQLDSSEIILLLLSADYFSSHYCWNVEARAAIERHEATRARLVPVLLRDVKWDVPPLKNYSVVPRNLKPVTLWPDLDQAFRQVVDEVDSVVDEILENPALSPAHPTHPRQQQAVITPDVFHCIPSFGDPVTVRAAGIAESLGDLVMKFRGDPGDRRLADIWLFANTNITSRIGPGDLSEATLLPATGECTTHLPTLRKGIRGKIGAANALAFLHVPLHELRVLPEAERNLRISNIRVNANQLGVGVPEHPSSVVVYVTVSETSVHPAPQFPMARIASDLLIEISQPGVAAGTGCFQRSEPINGDLLRESGAAGSLSFLVTFAGRLADHEQVPGERTRLMLIFGNVPAGVHLFCTTEEVSGVPEDLSASLTMTDATGAGPFQNSTIHGYASYENRSYALSKIGMHWGSGQAVWEIVKAGNAPSQCLRFGIALAYAPGFPQSLPHLGTASVSACLAPLSTVCCSSATAPVPRFADTSTAIDLFSIVP
jgi:hypothetical protein